MKIDTLHLVNSLSPNGITSKDNDFEMNELGVLVTPKGGIRSFTRRVRFIPWANIKACDIAEEKSAEPVITQPALLMVPAGAAVAPEDLQSSDSVIMVETPLADVIKFEKDKRTGMIVEKRMPHRSVEEPAKIVHEARTGLAEPDAAKSAFAKLRDVKLSKPPPDTDPNNGEETRNLDDGQQ